MGPSHVCNDGVTIAKEFELEDHDLIDAGIIDATKVVRVALENAVSVAGVLLLTEATLTEVDEPKRETSQAMEMA